MRLTESGISRAGPRHRNPITAPLSSRTAMFEKVRKSGVIRLPTPNRKRTNTAMPVSEGSLKRRFDFFCFRLNRTHSASYWEIALKLKGASELSAKVRLSVCNDVKLNFISLTE